MSDTVLVTGGTGTLGRLLVPRLREAGHEVRVLSRKGDGAGVVTGDLSTGEGVREAVAGADLVVHCAGSAKGDGEKARNLVAALPGGVRHLVYISVVGADRVPIESGIDRAMFGYYGAKHAGEQAVIGSGLPWTILRATQFHDLIATFFRMQRFSPAVFAPAFSLQPIAVEDVARRWVELLDADAAGRAPDIGGPETRTGRDLAGAFLAARGSRRPTLPLRLPGRTYAAYAAGANLVPGEPYGRPTFAEFLASHDDGLAARDARGRTDA